MPQERWSISVIICAYTEKRWKNLVAAIESVQEQTLPASEIIVVVDHNPQLLACLQNHLPEVIIIENTGAHGLSDARNSGIAAAKGQIVAFLDDDAVAMNGWLELLCSVFVDPKVLGVGGAIIPEWPQEKVHWFPEEFLWVVGCTYRGMPQTSESIRNPIGANMAFRREVFDGIGGFHSGIGRVGTLPVGCEETELCIRARQKWPERYFIYQPSAYVNHHISAQRLTWHYFCIRCYSEGVSKALVTKSVGIQDGLASERLYTFYTLPKGVLRGIVDTLCRREVAGIARSTAILFGLAITSTGYLVSKLQTKATSPWQNKTIISQSTTAQSNGKVSILSDDKTQVTIY